MKKCFPNILIIVSLFFIASTYFVLQPRVSNWFPPIREFYLSSFIRNTLKNNTISAQDFWILREFYSPGELQFIKPKTTFRSNRILSYETLVDKNLNLQTLLPLEVKNMQKVYQAPNELIATNAKEVVIYFIKPISEMKRANGFFDYKNKDKKLLSNKNWFVTTIITK